MAEILSFARGQAVLRPPGTATAAHWRLNVRNHPLKPAWDGVEPFSPTPRRA